MIAGRNTRPARKPTLSNFRCGNQCTSAPATATMLDCASSLRPLASASGPVNRVPNAPLTATGVHIQALVFDQASVIAGGPAAMASFGLRDRIEFVGGSFFEAMPAGADTYCLKDILHDWDDVDCVRILSRVRLAMAKSARLLIIERGTPPGNEPFAGKVVDCSRTVSNRHRATNSRIASMTDALSPQNQK